MDTPIYDFVKQYVSGNPVRLHMPGHKGIHGILGTEEFDITEIDGADNLSAPFGIIEKSEKNAGKIFGCRTFYSTEGSSLCIRAMLFLVKKYALCKGHSPLILAGRNAHKAFVNAAAVLDIDVEWIMQKECDSYETCSITGGELETIIKNGRKPDALYVTSPDYLGNMLDIKELAEVCHRNGVILLVDNAHGAYLKFLKKSLHPMDLGVDMCCDSAHKTLPVLTGGAYLNIADNDRGNSEEACSFFTKFARQALNVFASSSPSYLILESLDLCNGYLFQNTDIQNTADKILDLKQKLSETGYIVTGDEPLKITVSCPGPELNGTHLAELLKNKQIYVEYYDTEHVVMMFGSRMGDKEFEKIEKTFMEISADPDVSQYLAEQKEYKETIINSFSTDSDIQPRKQLPKRAMTFKEAMFADSEELDAKESVGRILAEPMLHCPPCVPLLVMGEVIDEETVKKLTGKVRVIKNSTKGK